MSNIPHERFLFIVLFSSSSLHISWVGPALLRAVSFSLEGWCYAEAVGGALRGPAGAAVHLHGMMSMVSGHGSFFYTQ